MSTDSASGAIALDAMGGDLGASEAVAAVALAFQQHSELGPITLVGREDELRPCLREHGLENSERVSIHHASEVIGMDEKPVESLKQKKDASLVRAIELVKDGSAKAAISQGNTGSLMACGTLRLRTAPGVERPALGLIMPTRDHHVVLCDVGANPDARPHHLVHNAVLASNYCRIALRKEKPRVGLLSIGTEENKGNERITLTHKLLKQLDEVINYCGPVEGFQIFENHVDVIVCDGFVGNILLKSSESLFHMLKDYMKEELTRTPLRKLGALLCREAFTGMKDQLNPDQYAGAPLLGLRGLIIKTHGSSNRHAICGALGVTSQLLRQDMRQHIENDVELANRIIKPTVEPEQEASSGATR